MASEQKIQLTKTQLIQLLMEGSPLSDSILSLVNESLNFEYFMQERKLSIKVSKLTLNPDELTSYEFDGVI